MRLTCALLGVLWALSPLIDAAHPLLIGAQATAWLGVVLMILTLLPGWRSRLLVATVIMVLVLGSPLVAFPGATSDLRVAALNTRHARADEGALHSELSALSPDIVVLSETSPAEAAGVANSLGLEVTGEIAADGHGVVVLAATTARAQQHDASFHQIPVVGLGSATVVGVHAAAPVRAGLAELWEADLTKIAAVLDQPGPVIAAGDFNATPGHPGFRNLPGQDCALPVATWPMPVSGLHLDHIVVSGAECTGAGTFAVPGTDHRGVWADVRV